MKFIAGITVLTLVAQMFTVAAITTVNATERQAQEWRSWR